MTDSLAKKAPPALLGTRRQFLIGASCLAAAAIAFVRKPRTDDSFMGAAKLEDIVPAHFAGWDFVTASGLVLPPQDQLQSEIYQQLLTRVYSRGDGQSIMLLIAYGGSQDGVIQIHRPEICYPASGYSLSTIQNHVARLAPGVLIPSRFIVADSPARKEQMIYWTRLGADFPRRWTEQRLSVFEQNMAGIIPMACWCGFPPTTPMPCQPSWIALPPISMAPAVVCSDACSPGSARAGALDTGHAACCMIQISQAAVGVGLAEIESQGF